MTQEVDSAALSLADRAFGLSGVDAEQLTFVDDGVLNQTREMNPIARRSRVPFQRGIFGAAFENVHGVGGSLQSFIDPYNPVNVHGGFPAVVDPELFDIWLLDAAAHTDVGANVTLGLLYINTPGPVQGVSDTAAGGAATPSRNIPLGGWDDWTAFSDSLGREFGSNQGILDLQLKRRLLPGQVIIFRTEVTGACTTAMWANLFIGPITLGQDLW